MEAIKKVLEITVVLILVYLVARNSKAFSELGKVGGGVYIGAVKALQGR